MEGIHSERLHKYGGTEMWTELRSLKQDAEAKYVDVEPVKTHRVDKVDERQVVDGAHGVARKHVDVTFLGETRDETNLLVGEF